MHSNLKQFDQAIEDAEKAIKIKPDYSKAYLRLGKAYEGKNDIEKAIEIYTLGLNKDKKNIQLFDALKKLNVEPESVIKEASSFDEPKNSWGHENKQEENIGKNNLQNLIEKYALNTRVELTFVRQISDYRIIGKIEEISGGFISFIKENNYNNTYEHHLINISNIIDIHILE